MDTESILIYGGIFYNNNNNDNNTLGNASALHVSRQQQKVSK